MSEEVKKVENTKKKPIKIIFSVLGYIALGLLLILDVFAITSKVRMKGKSGGMTLFGNEVRLVLTGSMNGSKEFYNGEMEDTYFTKEEKAAWNIKRIGVHAAVSVKNCPLTAEKREEFCAKFKKGDVMTFYYPVGGETVVVTHRIVAIKENYANGERVNITFSLRGDNPSGDQIVSKYSPIQTVNSDSGWVIGKVVGSNQFFGHVLWGFVANKIILALVVIIPSALLMCFEIGKTIFYIYLDKKEAKEAVVKAEQAAHEAEQQSAISERDEELARLREELERLRGGQTNDQE